MENASNNFAESIADAMLLEDQYSNFNMQVVNYAEPDDEDEDVIEDEVEEEDTREDRSRGSDDDNPPLDKDVVHSPLRTQTGGKPGA